MPRRKKNSQDDDDAPAFSKSETARRLRWGQNNINAGRLRELPYISIDRFVGDELKASVFFLTHVHTDHMVGLEFPEFLERLNCPDVKLYVSSVTPMLLPMFGRYLGGRRGVRDLLKRDKIIPLDVHMEYNLQYLVANGESKDVKVTLLPAGHCPGSVMILLEFDEKRVLYTGDCRVSVEDLMGMTALHQVSSEKKSSGNSRVKSIDALYVDSTFCSVDRNFPFRGEAIQESISHIQNWLSETNKFIRMSFSARVAHEYVLIKLFKTLNLKTHVSVGKFDAYKHIPGIKDCVTRDPNARIHLCDPKDDCLGDKLFMTIRLSSMWYTTTPNIPDNIFSRRGNTLTLCYAMHSSLLEVGQMIDYLKPDYVTPLVLPRYCGRKDLEFGLKSISQHTFTYQDNMYEPRVSSAEETQSSLETVSSQELRAIMSVTDNSQELSSASTNPEEAEVVVQARQQTSSNLESGDHYTYGE